MFKVMDVLHESEQSVLIQHHRVLITTSTLMMRAAESDLHTTDCLRTQLHSVAMQASRLTWHFDTTKQLQTNVHNPLISQQIRQAYETSSNQEDVCSVTYQHFIL